MPGGIDDLDRLGVEQLERHAGDVDRVAGHVAEGAGAEVQPAAPGERLVARVVRPVMGGAEELVPVDVVGDADGVSSGPADALRPDRAIGPDVDLLDRPEDAGPDQLDAARKPFSAVPWLPIWVASFFSAARVAHHAGLLDRPGQRLLA